jgi:hypothetical protein
MEIIGEEETTLGSVLNQEFTDKPIEPFQTKTITPVRNFSIKQPHFLMAVPKVVQQKP